MSRKVAIKYKDGEWYHFELDNDGDLTRLEMAFVNAARQYSGVWDLETGAFINVYIDFSQVVRMEVYKGPEIYNITGVNQHGDKVEETVTIPAENELKVHHNED